MLSRGCPSIIRADAPRTEMHGDAASTGRVNDRRQRDTRVRGAQACPGSAHAHANIMSVASRLTSIISTSREGCYATASAHVAAMAAGIMHHLNFARSTLRESESATNSQFFEGCCPADSALSASRRQMVRCIALLFGS
jgi:hypothetical protein